MKIKKCVLNNIKSFRGTNQFDFNTESSIFTISGKNGSGKTTVFKSIQLAQKAFFLKQLTLSLNYDSLFSDFIEQLQKSFIHQNSYIEITFDIEGSLHKLKLKNLATSNSYEIEISEEDNEAIIQFWNVNNPKYIMLLIDASKSFSNETVEYSNINISNSSNYSLLHECIFKSEDIFSHIYETVVRDYVHERIIPGTGGDTRIFYNDVAKTIFMELMPELSIKNFSSSHIQNEFVLLGKSNGSKAFDIREFSSGEKALFFTLLFISYVPQLGMIAIDEPENHFHEQLLNKFVFMLHEISMENNLKEWLVKKFGSTIKNKTLKKFENHKINQIFFLTHSKNLIYNNFSNGVNYYIENNQLRELNYENREQILREMGLSSIYSKILFVEGTGDSKVLSDFLSQYDVKVKSLGGSKEVIDTFKRLASVIDNISDISFCFLVDRDNKPDEYFESIRSTKPSFYDKSFIVLNRHEFENYLLEEELFFASLERHEHEENNIPSKEDIKDKLFSIALDKSSIAFRKEFNFKLQKSIDTYFSQRTYGNRDFEINNSDDTKQNLEQVFDNSNISSLLNEIKQWHDESLETYKEENFIENWKKKCDGKVVLNIAINHFSQYSTNKKVLQSDLEKKALEITTLDIKPLLDRIISIFRT